ncbi:hypothetical protein DL771_003037 [Monosporascus sp. 5C6A]|nr:hypothetical protein DL771_003037 [Monosporascus sp. 5C6A]
MEGLKDVMVSQAHGLIHDAYSERHHFMSGDHLGLCRFEKDQKEQFRVVPNDIEWLIDQKPKPIDSLGPQERRALYSLCQESFHRFFIDRLATDETCDWIMEKPVFKDFGNTTGKHKLWIYGGEGCGKSFLARHIIDSILPSRGQEPVYCFVSDSVPGRGNLEALLRATLHQASRLAPETVSGVLLPTFDAAQNREAHDDEIWAEPILKSLWPEAMAKVTAQRPLAFVIDGLDEISRECQEGFFSCLEKFENNLGEDARNERQPAEKSGGDKPPTTRFILLILSRNHPQLDSQAARHGFGRYNMTPQDARADIERTVKAGLDNVWKSLTQVDEMDLRQDTEPRAGMDSRWDMDFHPEMVPRQIKGKEGRTRKNIVRGSKGTYAHPAGTMEKKPPGQVDRVEPRQQEASKDIIKISKGKNIHAAKIAEQKPLKRTDGVDPGVDKVCKSIVDGSKGTYLHAATVVEHLGRTPLVSEIQILKLVEKLPHDLKQLYDHILRNTFAKTDNLPFIEQVLLWALFQKDRLKVAEFNIAQALGLAINKHPENSVHPEVLRDLLDDNIKIKLDLYCGHIVKFSEERLEFIHGSLRSYFLAQPSKFHPELELDERRSHTLLANICIAYLTLPYFSNSGPALEPGRMDLWESKVRKRIRDHAFVRYAALNWFKHLADARRAWPGPNTKAFQGREKLEDGNTEYAKCWTEVWWFFTRGPNEE